MRNDLPAKVKRIDATVHESETVGRTDDRITGDVQDKAVMDLNKLQIAAEPAPRFRQSVIDRC